MTQLSSLLRTFRTKVVEERPILLCASIVLLIGALQLAVVVHISLSSRSETALGERRNLAEKLALDIERSFDRTAAQERIREFEESHSDARVYLLDKLGVLLPEWSGSAKAKLPFVDIKAIRRYIDDPVPDPSLLAEDPMDLKSKRPFASAELELDGKQAYLYIVFDSALVPISALVQDISVMKAIVLVTACTLILGAAAILALWLSVALRVRKMGETMANVSHDLRTPIASIQGYLETILLKDAAMNEEQKRQFLSVALRNTHALGSLVSDLLQISKMDGKGVPMEEFSLYELTGDIIMKFMPLAKSKNIELAVTGDPYLPLAYGNIGMIERVISNLIENALRHTPNGGKVSLFLLSAGTSLKVKVMDTGCGIPQEKIPKIFDRLFSGAKPGTDPMTSGSGLGLAITQKIVEAHNGTIKVKSKVDEGTIVELDLPRLH